MLNVWWQVVVSVAVGGVISVPLYRWFFRLRAGVIRIKFTGTPQQIEKSMLAYLARQEAREDDRNRHPAGNGPG